MSDLEAYDYELPKELIAQQPARLRTDARLMVVDRARGTIEDSHIRDLPELLRPGDCLVLNNTRVVPARLIGFRTRTEGRWEGLFLAAEEHGIWRLLSKTRGRLEPGETITLCDRQGRPDIRLAALKRLERGEWLMMPEQPEEAFEVLDRVGRVPLPKYIREGEMLVDDVER